jgi:hypothetical protein
VRTSGGGDRVATVISFVALIVSLCAVLGRDVIVDLYWTGQFFQKHDTAGFMETLKENRQRFERYQRWISRSGLRPWAQSAIKWIVRGWDFIFFERPTQREDNER